MNHVQVKQLRETPPEERLAFLLAMELPGGRKLTQEQAEDYLLDFDVQERVRLKIRTVSDETPWHETRACKDIMERIQRCIEVVNEREAQRRQWTQRR